MNTYNTDPSLWKAFKAQRDRVPNIFKPLKIIDGHVFDENECIGRFESCEMAEVTLKQSGFKQQNGGWE